MTCGQVSEPDPWLRGASCSVKPSGGKKIPVHDLENIPIIICSSSRIGFLARAKGPLHAAKLGLELNSSPSAPRNGGGARDKPNADGLPATETVADPSSAA